MQGDHIDEPGHDDDVLHNSAEITAKTFLMCLVDRTDGLWLVADLFRQTDAGEGTAKDALAMLIRDGLCVCSGALVVPTRAALRGDELAV
jgi:ABC-type nickel/cobalt efflux system permease component RcnA